MSLPIPTVTRWEEATGGLLVEGYGMTETSPMALGNPAGPSRRPGTVGVPFPSTEIRVVDPADPATVRAPGEEGELLVRGPQVSRQHLTAYKVPERVVAVDALPRNQVGKVLRRVVRDEMTAGKTATG